MMQTLDDLLNIVRDPSLQYIYLFYGLESKLPNLEIYRREHGKLLDENGKS